MFTNMAMERNVEVRYDKFKVTGIYISGTDAQKWIIEWYK